MKIDGNRPADTAATDATKRTTADTRVQRSGITPARDKSDRVDVSPDAKLMSDALDAAQKSPAIRTELVERLKQKLNSGELGKDSGKLADRLIDDLLGK